MIWVPPPPNLQVRVARQFTVKKVCGFPVPSRDVTNQTLPGWEYFNYTRPERVRLVTSRLGTGKSINFFYSVYTPQSTVYDRTMLRYSTKEEALF
jgi:hypothetical protein